MGETSPGTLRGGEDLLRAVRQGLEMGLDREGDGRIPFMIMIYSIIINN